MAAPASRAAYAAHLQGTILPSLASARDAIARVDQDILEYEQVARRLARELSGRRGAPVELGAGVWADAVVTSTARVTLDLGLDVHVSLPAEDAAKYAAERAEMLRKRRGVLAARAERLKWEAEQFEGAINE